MPSKIRLYLDHALGPDQTVPLDPARAHYLFGVMRRGLGEVIEVFDGRNGAWDAEVIEARKKSGVLRVGSRVAPQRDPPDLWLLFAPIKRARTDFIVEKAAEMGARRILPVQTEHTNSERVRRERLQAHAIEAAEQCGGTFVPEVAEIVRLDRVLSDWPPERQLMFCDEGLAGQGGELPARGGPWAILIGPEGGFSEAERARLGGMAGAHAVALGPRILRADTAAVAAMTLWQARLGDWA